MSKVQKAILWLAVGFVIYAIVVRPVVAAAFVHTVYHAIIFVGTGILEFFRQIMK